MAILVGTASWTDKTLIASGRFYPKDATSAEARLRYYASQFPLVEVDSSYYAMPVPATAQLWAERTPEHLVMNVKAFRLFTGHQTSPTVLHRDLQLAWRDAPRSFYYADVPPETENFSCPRRPGTPLVTVTGSPFGVIDATMSLVVIGKWPSS